MKRHVNIPIFIPHLGCPNQCVFCNQRTISGVSEFEAESVVGIIESALETIGRDVSCEIAFFGGSFTGIDRDLMIRLLKIANSYLLSGRVKGIRCSTRPDYIDGEILKILKEYGVKTIELGLQSVDEDVLSASKRGHGFLSEKEACHLIVENGFSLIGQMMIGLPKATCESEIQTAEFIISSGAVGARIYPTVVFHHTELAHMCECGDYVPLSEDEAVRRSAAVMRKFIDSGVEVIRVGLCSSENLASESTYYKGPNHPAIGELVENELFYGIIREEIIRKNIDRKSLVEITVPRGSLSKAIGQKKKNKLRIIDEFSYPSVRFKESSELFGYSVSVREER